MMIEPMGKGQVPSTRTQRRATQKSFVLVQAYQSDMSKSRLWICVLQVALLASIAHMAVSQSLGDCKRGRATYYTVDSVGACGFGADAGIYTFAPNEAFFNNSERCGECYEVTGPLGTRTMMVSNACPVSGNEQWCSGDYTHFDIDSRAFPEIGDASYGVMYTSIRPVVCPSTGGVSIVVGDYNAFYLPVFFLNHKVGIRSVAMSMPNMAKTSINRSGYNAWISPENQQINYPVTYEVTSMYGETITVTIPQAPTQTRQKFTNTAQFTQWTTPTQNTCPSVHDFDVFVNGWNPDVATNHMVAQNWRTFRSSANPNYIADVPHNASKAIQDSLAQWNEWGFGTVVPIPEDKIAAIEIQLKSSVALTELRFSWRSGSTYNTHIFPVSANTWEYHYFPKSVFSQSTLGPLDVIAIQPNAATTLTVANFRVLPMEGVTQVPTQAPSSQTPSPQNPPSAQNPPSSQPSSQNPPSVTPSGTPSVTPTGAPSGTPSSQTPSSSASTLSLAALYLASGIALLL